MDIPLGNPLGAVDEETVRRVTETLKSGRYILGDRVREFEESFSAFTGTRRSVAVSSGTAALHVALLACGIGKGDEVITTANSFIATANAIVHAGARPVLVDAEPRTMNIDPERIEENITERTRAIMPVHLYGHPADMDHIIEIAERHDLLVIEDSCQAHGAEHRGRKAGSIGHAACFSFFPSKIMTVLGDGGMITTNDEDIAERSSMLRNHGRRSGEKYSHDVIGFNYRMSELAATIGSVQLKALPGNLESRRRISREYDRLLDGIESVRTPYRAEWANPSYYVYTIRSEKREGLSRFLRESGIATGIYYPVPINQQPAYRDYGFGSFPVSEQAAKEILSLPMHQFLTSKEISSVTERVREFFSPRGA